MKKTEKTVMLSFKETKQIEKWLREPESRDDFLPEDFTYSKTVKFYDGIEADIKICGVSWHGPEEGISNAPYTEMVLFKDGSEICCTDAGECFDGNWSCEYNGVEYSVIVTMCPFKSESEMVGLLRNTVGFMFSDCVDDEETFWKTQHRQSEKFSTDRNENYEKI